MAQARRHEDTYQGHLSLEDVLSERRRGKPALFSTDMAVDMQSEVVIAAKTPLRQYLIPALTCACLIHISIRFL